MLHRVNAIVYVHNWKNDFKNLGYILKGVNHSIWFGEGSLHNNTIELLWSQIKNIT